MRILKILIILLLLVFPLGELLRFDIGNNIRFKPLDFIAGVIMAYWFVLCISKRIHLPKGSWFYFVFPIVGLISLILNSYWLSPTEVVGAGLYLIRWVSYLSIFFVVVHLDKNFKKKLIAILLLDGLIIVFLGFIQFFFFSNLKPLYFLGWDDHMYRMFSVFLDPNYTGAFFSLNFILCMGLFYKYIRDNRSQDVNIIKFKKLALTKKQVIIFLAFTAFVSLIALFLTFSRSSLLMLIVSASVFFILIGRKKFILLLFGIIIAFTLMISSQFYIENINLFRQASSGARITNYQSAIRIINDNALIGVGFNSYRYAKKKYDIQMGWVSYPSHADAGVDNSFLFVIATTGLVGLFAYLFLWCVILKRAFLFYKTKSNTYAIIVIASAMGLFVHAMFINSLFFPAIMVWMWILVGLMERK
jgi:O-antigen ligase